MIEKLERHTRVEKGLTQDIKISCPPGQSEIVSKINELVDAVNSLRDDCNLLMEYIAPENKCEPAENVQEFITLTDVFNEMGRLYADLWNKMEDIHHDLKTKGGNNE